MRRGRPIKTTSSPQPILTDSDPFVKLGPSTSAARFEFSTASEDDDIASRFPTIEELSGGEFTSSTTNRSQSQPPHETSSIQDVGALADDAFALPVQPYRTKEVHALADDAFKSDSRPSPAERIRAALEREKDQTEWVEPIQTLPTSSDDDEEERVVKPSEVIARGGVYTQSHPSHSISAPLVITNPPVTLERIPDVRSVELRRKAEESRRIIDESRKILEQQWPDAKEPVPRRPKMVSVGTMTSPPPSPPQKPKELHGQPPFMELPSSQLPAPISRSPGLSSQHFTMQETEVRPYRSKTPIPSPSKLPHKDYTLAESPRPKSRGVYPVEQAPLPLGKGLPKQRPQSMYVDNDLEFLRSYDKNTLPLEKSHTGLSTSSQPASLPSTSSELHLVESEQDLDHIRMKYEETKGQPFNREHTKDPDPNERRSSSSAGGQKHSRQTSLGALSKGIMSGKFSDAFRKFEGFSSHHDPPKVSESRYRAERTLAKLSPEDEAVEDKGKDWRVETHEIPVKMRQHLSDTRRISAERDTRPTMMSLGNPKPNVLPQRAVTTSSKAKMIQQRMNDYLNAQNEKPPPLTADGYGPYISDARAVRNLVEEEDVNERKGRPPGVPTKPNILRRPSLKGSVD